MSSLVAPLTSNSNRVAQEALDAGSYPARVSRVISLGLQPTIDFATKEAGKPAHMVSVTYELVDAFMVDENGNELEDKPRWISEDFPLRALSSDLATSTKRIKALDATGSLRGDWTQTLGLPCMVVLGQYETKKNPGVLKNKVMNVTAARKRDADNMPDLQNEAKFFDLSNPDIEFFNSLPTWTREKIQSNLEYPGSRLEALLEGTPAPKETPPPPPVTPAPNDEPEDAPW